MKCQRCDQEHPLFRCPYVKAMTFDADHNMIRVEFLTPADYGPPQPLTALPDDYPKLGPRKP